MELLETTQNPDLDWPGSPSPQSCFLSLCGLIIIISSPIPQPDLQPVLVTPREGTLKQETVLRHLRLLFFLSDLNREAEVGLAAVVCPVTGLWWSMCTGDWER